MILQRLATSLRKQDWFTVLIETLIVVFGVFIGLQLGNLNSEGQLRQQETELLGVLADDLQSNLSFLDENIEFDRASIEACDQILDLVERGDEWSREDAETMGVCRGWSSPSFNTYGFETLQSVGVDIVSNPDLRRSVSELYTLTYATMKEDRDRSFWIYHEAVLVPTIAKYLVYPEDQTDAGLGRRRLMPQDLNSLNATPEFTSVLLGKRAYQTWSIENQVEVRAETRRVLDEIEAELAK